MRTRALLIACLHFEGLLINVAYASYVVRTVLSKHERAAYVWSFEGVFVMWRL